MNVASAEVDHYLAEFEEVAPTLAGYSVPWVKTLREQALSRFASAGFPTPREEDWKYTRVTPIQRRTFSLPGRGGPAPDAGVLRGFQFDNLPCHTLVFVNGRYVAPLSNVGHLPEGITIRDLASALNDPPDSLQSYLAGNAPIHEANSFAALNTAFLADGAYIHIAQGCVLEHPIRLLYLALGEETELVAYPRNLIVTDRSSEVSIIESYVSSRDAVYFNDALTEIHLGDNASIQHYKIQEESLKAFHIAGIYVHQGADSRFTSHSYSFGGSLVRNDVDVVLDAEGAQCVLNGLYLAGGRQHVDHHTRIDHAKPRSTSREIYRGVLDGHGRAVFNGRASGDGRRPHRDRRNYAGSPGLSSEVF
jgi:Fe-S cluster assembly protein SufD